MAHCNFAEEDGESNHAALVAASGCPGVPDGLDAACSNHRLKWDVPMSGRAG